MSTVEQKTVKLMGRGFTNQGILKACETPHLIMVFLSAPTYLCSHPGHQKNGGRNISYADKIVGGIYEREERSYEHLEVGINNRGILQNLRFRQMLGKRRGEIW